MAQKPTTISISVPNGPPLASIEETDEDLALASTSPCNPSFIASSVNKNLFILTNPSAKPVPAIVPASEPAAVQTRASILSPESDDFGALTTMTMATVSGLADDELADTGFFSSSMSCSSKRSSVDSASLQAQLNAFTGQLRQEEEDDDDDDDEEALMDDFLDGPLMAKSRSSFTVASTPGEESTIGALGSQSPELSNSLENLVNCFDEKVKNCLRNFEENVANLAPVQVRTQEEFIRDRPAWWTLTGNYGNILPLDWAKLSPGEHGSGVGFISEPTSLSLFEDDEDGVDSEGDPSTDMRLKRLLDVCLELDSTAPIKSADEVLEEIDAIMSERMTLLTAPPTTTSDLRSLSSEQSFDLSDVPLVRRMSFYRFSLEKLKNLSLDALQDLNEDLESKVQSHSETLVKELARRDELEFEKEQKNAFISLMLSLQNRRKAYFMEKQNGAATVSATVGPSRKLRYLTTVIPYIRQEAADNVPILQVLIKILKAMLEDSPTVPTLLTDYILKYICPCESYINGASGQSAGANHSSKTYVKSALRSLARGHSFTSSGASPAALSSLTASLGSRLQAARRSFSFKNGNSPVASSCGRTVNNNNPEKTATGPGTTVRKLSAPSSTFDSCNAIVA